MQSCTTSPEYWRSLLRVEVPITVTLASTKMPVEQIMSLVPGVMIQFEKSCDAPLILEVDGSPVAEGDAVKVGDKFGLRIKEILPPGERFITVWPDRNSASKVVAS